jgi:chromosome segregation ATPase
MDKKIKLLVIGLGVLAAISLLIAFQLNLTNKKIQLRKEAIEKELATVSQENEKLTQDLSAALAKNKAIANDVKVAEEKGIKLQEEIDRLKERLDLSAKERDSFIDKIQNLIDDKRKVQEELTKEKAKVVTMPEGEEGTGGPTTIYSPASSQEAFWADVLRQKANAELELENVRTQLKEITYRADEVLKQRNALELELKNASQTKEDLERQSSYNEKLAKALSEDLVREKNDKEALASQLEGLRDDNTEMRARIKDLENVKTTLYKKIDNLEQERNALKDQLVQTESVVTERVGEIVKIKKDLENFQAKDLSTVVPGSRTVELSPIVVVGKEDATKAPLTGRVLSINKDNSFVIVDLGEASGIAVNDRLNIYRENMFIASIQVIQARKDISAADIVESTVGQEIKVGDIARSVR